MNHKRNRTTRREVKRLDNKAFRQATKKAMNGRTPQNPPQDKWGYRAPDMPLLTEACNGPSLGKHKERPKKAPSQPRCPNGQHEWYEETTTFKTYTYACPHDFERGRMYYRRPCDCAPSWPLMGSGKNPFNKVHYTEYTQKKTCIHCWKVRVIRKWDDNPFGRAEWPYSWRARRKARKIRTQDLVSGMTTSVR